MGYVNERLKEEKRRTYDLGDGRKKTPGLVTINREKDCIFFKDYTEIDNPVNEHFVFVYKGKVINMVLNGENFTENDVRIWRITSIYIPEVLSREEVLDELSDALKGYGCFGSPPNPRFGDTSGDAITDF